MHCIWKKLPGFQQSLNLPRDSFSSELPPPSPRTNHSQRCQHSECASSGSCQQHVEGQAIRFWFSKFGSICYHAWWRSHHLHCSRSLSPASTSPTLPPPQTPKTDVYSYGVLLDEVVTQELPDPIRLQGMVQQVRRQWPRIRPLVTGCIQHSPESRPTMAYILEELDKLTSWTSLS